MPGPLALVGGAEFRDGNDDQDALLAKACAGRSAYVIASAAVRGNPDAAVATAHRWFQRFDLNVSELPLRTATQARDARGVAQAQAREAGFIYLAGGDPGLIVRLLAGSPVWDAVVAAWRDGAALAGSSAGAMALCRWTLLRERWPVASRRRWADALDVVPSCAAVPHFNTMGESWLPSALAEKPAAAVLVGVDERTAAVFHDGSWSALGPGAVTIIDDSGTRTFTDSDAVCGLPLPQVSTR